ncbi:hypothetical protein Kim5_CH02883 [Rhizobium sp. Kim5]|uniref:hypothetical protein n=1 Tax=Rhizobium sp. Kim5 TaxID=2020311 RepID=UPI000A2A1845|nr:hypothetical protein [Rhizobium sp. Kim5]ARQ58926.1 hypothetical protein Kim5_CH02883 [Rhizobium sp. Kim5]
MTEIVRTPEQEAAYQHLITARFREAARIDEAVEAFLVAHADLPFENRLDFTGRKEFLLPFFSHLSGIERAMVVSQAAFKISDRIWRAERERLEGLDA